jgi:PEGA domain-containing protein
MRVMSLCAVLALVAAPGRATAAGGVGVFWQPPGEHAQAAAARAAFADAMRERGARLVDAPAPKPAAPPSLVPALEAAKEEYARFKFADALAHLDAVQRLADAHGGGDLDARQLSEIFLYRGLCRLETGADDAAWEDLVRAARLDPARVMDPARFPPRAVAAYQRAANEAARLERLPLTIEAPPGAAVRVDGAEVGGTLTLTAGQHFVHVAADGYEPWSGLVTVPAAQGRFTPPLRAWEPPDADQLLALAGDPSVHELWLGALVRRGAAWRFVARRITLPDGTFVNDSVMLGDLPVRVAVQATVRRLLPSAEVRPQRRWLPWVVAGGAAALAGVAITLGVVYGSPSPAVSGDVKLP